MLTGLGIVTLYGSRLVTSQDFGAGPRSREVPIEGGGKAQLVEAGLCFTCGDGGKILITTVKTTGQPFDATELFEKAPKGSRL